MKHTVVGLDLSKTFTGYAIGDWDARSGEGRITRFGTIRPHAAAKGTRWFFPVIDALIGQLEAELVAEPWFERREFSLVIEACIYGESFSEFQFFLGQEVLRWAARLVVDVCTVAPGTLKAWVRRWSKRDLPKKLDKVEIELIWRQELRPLCPTAFPSSLPSQITDDSVDAGWLALLGLYAQAHILPVGRFDLDLDYVEPLFLGGGDAVRDIFLKRKLNRLTNIEQPDLSGTYANLRSNKHLGRQSKSFYPFRQLDALAQTIQVLNKKDPEGTLASLKKEKRPDVSEKSLREALAGAFSCSLDSAGRLLLVPKPGRPAWRRPQLDLKLFA